MKEVFSFESLSQMVATSDLVIEGTVQEVEPGRVLGEGDAAIQFAQVTLSVDRVLFARVDAASVVLEEYGLELGHPSRLGDHGVYFLHQKTDAPALHRLVNSQGRFLDDGKGGLVAPNDGVDWVKLSRASLSPSSRATSRLRPGLWPRVESSPPSRSSSRPPESCYAQGLALRLEVWSMDVASGGKQFALSSVSLPDGLGATRMVIGEGAVWALASTNEGGSNVLVRIDPSNDEVVATTRLEADAWYLGAGGGSIWVGFPHSSAIQQVDAATNEVTGQWQVPGDGVSAITADDQDVWVEVIQDRSDQGQQNLASLVRIDPRTAEVVATIPLKGCRATTTRSPSVAGPSG